MVMKDADVTELIEQQQTLLEVVQRMAAKLDEMSDELDEMNAEIAALQAEHEPVPAPLPIPDEEPSYWQRAKTFFGRAPKGDD
ncbi:MAG: hypothetical protein ACXV46_08755 [Halobacteriota archaeon]